MKSLDEILEAMTNEICLNSKADAYDGDEILYLQPFDTKTKYSLGKTWQAYRKERG